MSSKNYKASKPNTYNHNNHNNYKNKKYNNDKSFKKKNVNIISKEAKNQKEKQHNNFEDKNLKKDINIKKEERKMDNFMEKELNQSKNTTQKEKVSDNSYDNDSTFKRKEVKMKKHFFVHLFLIVMIIVSVAYLGINICNKNASALELMGKLLLTLFTILFALICITSNKKNKSIMFLCGLLLLGYMVLDFANYNNLNDKKLSSKSITSILNWSKGNVVVGDFRGKNLTSVMKWAEENNVTINQDYEYSDMVDEYKIISQDKEFGTKLEKEKEITVSVSEGPNPSKEVIVPSMITWNCERVLEFIKDNYLSNVTVEFVESDKAQDTVIEQNTSGTLKRDDELKLTFSYGEELGYDEVSLIDFTGKSKFEVEFYMKQHQLKYEFDNDFSNKQKRGLAIKQSIKAGHKVKINDETVKVTISKGPKIKVPDVKGMSMTEVTEWAIKNKVKLEFSDRYDDSVKENDVIEVNFKKGEIIEQGTVLKMVLSRGKLVMLKFKSFDEFREWADKYEIKYEEKHEFNDDVAVGEVISYSYKKGDTIKNGDTIIVKISDGKKCEVPNLKGLTKSEAIAKLKKADLKYNFVYSSSNDVPKDKVISQSISAGSDVSSGTTITVTLSNGKKESSNDKKNSSSSNNKGNSSSNNSGNSGGSNSGGNSGGSQQPPACDKSKTTTVYIYPELLSNSPSTTCSKIKSAYPYVKFSCSYVANPGLANGLVDNSGAIDGKALNHCDTYTLRIVKND